MKRFLSLMLLSLVCGQSIAQQPGDVLWSLLTSGDTIYSIKVQPDGKLVAAGNSHNGSYGAIAVGRFDGDVPDLSFGNNGVVTTSLANAHTVAKAVEIQQDGKIVVAGSYRTGTVSDFMLVRYKPDGGVDSSFGINGIVQTDVGSGSSDFATALAIQPDGKIVAAGASASSLALCRYKADGSLDSSFDSDGKLLTVAVAGATSMMLQANGKIVVCCGGGVIRLHPDGSVDNSFGINGVATPTSNCYGMAIQNDGKILLAGGIPPSGSTNSQFVVERLDTAGVHDNGFGSGGVVTTGGSGGFVQGNSGGGATAVCVQADGRILAAGWARYGIGNMYRGFAVARYKTNGARDSSFGGDGTVCDPYTPAFGWAISYSAAINNSEVILAGYGVNGGGWALASYYLGPLLNVRTTPSSDGQITVAPNPAEEFARIQSKHIENGNWHLTLCDLTGRALYSETVVVSNNALDKSISLIGLPAEMYLVKLDNGIERMTVKLAKSR